MGTQLTYIYPLTKKLGVKQVGRKAFALQKLHQAGFKIPISYCITTKAYIDFLKLNNLQQLIDIEVGRKDFLSMRWEEIWDCALRIRNQIMRAQIPHQLLNEIALFNQQNNSTKAYAVRSTSPQEDMRNASFAGVYDSYINCCGLEEIQHSVRKVWASLWSDKALLYRKELHLDPIDSSMAVLIQEMIDGDYSGVAFSRNPNNPKLENISIEAVSGLCSNLVDGLIEPRKYIINREKLLIKTINPSAKNISINNNLLQNLARILLKIEKLFKTPVDVEWTLINGELIILQARPISYQFDDNEQRKWYLTLTPQQKQLEKLSIEVKEQLIPKLRSEGDIMQQQELKQLNDLQLAHMIEKRSNTLKSWRNIYKEKFIPFAHGVRLFAQYYNDVVKPSDPYEFIQLLTSQTRIANLRLATIKKLAKRIAEQADLLDYLQQWKRKKFKSLDTSAIQTILKFKNGRAFIESYEKAKKEFFDISMGDESWFLRDDLIIQILLQYACTKKEQQNLTDNEQLKQQYFNSSNNINHAKHVLNIGRLSWQLRDDDNLLLGRIESQLIVSLEQAKQRLVQQQRLSENHIIHETDTRIVIDALINPKQKIHFNNKKSKLNNLVGNVKARQLKGQPAVPGMATGTAIQINCIDDIKQFNPGNIIICDAIDPNMTHIVPLAKAIVERRGGMLIHGVIIARELGIPCVNGIPNLMRNVKTGEVITVDGTQGLVIVGTADFDF